MLGRLSIYVSVFLALAGCMDASETAKPNAPPPASPAAPPTPASPVATPEAPALASPVAPIETPAPPSAPALPAGPYEFATGMNAGAFEHARLDAQPQVTVRWTNRDNIVHSVVSTDGGFAGSGPIQPGSEFTATFLAPGDYAFHCRYHGAMLGSVIVR